MTLVKLSAVFKSLVCVWELVHSIAIPLPKSGHRSVAAYNVDKPSTHLNGLSCAVTETTS
jgi:hypothetical protein